MGKKKNGDGNPLGGAYQPPVASSAVPESDPEQAFQNAVASARLTGSSYRYMDQQWQRSNYAWAARNQYQANYIDAVNDFNRQRDENRPDWVKWIDNHVVPDDIGGFVSRATPAPVRAGLSVAGAAYDWASNRSSQAATWGLSALPGGVQTVDWDVAGRISPGRMRVALGVQRGTGTGAMAYYNYEQDQAKVRANYEAAVKAGDPGVITGSVPAPDGPGDKPIVVPENWDITKPEDEAWLFGNAPGYNNGASVKVTSPQDDQANIESGLTDAAVVWYMDPLVVGGKGIKIYRYGSDVLGIAGRTNRGTHFAQVQRQVEVEGDSAMQFFNSGGTQGARNHIYTWAENIAKRTGDELANEPWARGPHKIDLLNVADQINDVPTAIKFILAGSGNRKYVEMLRKDAASVADAMESVGRRSPYEYLQLNAPIGSLRPVMLDDVLESGYTASAIFDDAVKRNGALQDAVKLLEDTYSPIQQVGRMHGSLLMTEVAQAWRASKANAAMRKAARGSTQVDSAVDNAPLDMNLLTAETVDHSGIPTILPGLNLTGPTTARVTDIVRDITPNRVANDAVGKTSPIVETVYNVGSKYRSIGIWDWVGKQRSAGWITIRGYDKYDSEQEFVSALTDSRALKNSGTWVQDAVRSWRKAVSPEEKLRLKDTIEQEAVKKVAAYYNLPEELALSVWKHVNGKRQNLLDVFSRRDGKGRAFGVDPEDGKTIWLSPVMRSQLDTMVPLLDFRLMDRTMRNLSRTNNPGKINSLISVIEKSGKVDGTQLAEGLTEMEKGALWTLESLNSTWKAAVLFRLGYTQRNTLEGWLRTAAVLGSIPALAPSAVAQGAYRVAVGNPKAKRIAGRVGKAEAQVANMMEDNRRAISILDSDIEDYVRVIGGIPASGLHTQQFFHLNNLRAMREELIAKNTELAKTVDRLREVRATKGKKKYIGWDEAYSGEYGDLRRQSASNQITQDRFFQSRAAANNEKLRLSNQDYGPVEPDKPQYWQELHQAAVQQRADPSMRNALSGMSPEEMKAWLGTPEGRSYARDMLIGTDAEANALVARQWALANAYFPTPELRSFVLSGKEVPSPNELRAMMGGRSDLAVVHGRQVAEDTVKFRSPIAAVRDKMFYWLGTRPDSTLVRQPFYNSVWKSEYSRLWQSAKRQGYDMNDAKFLRQINDTAHSRALKATNETLFTLMRYSNPAAVMRFISPFFAAWENSMRTWLGIITRDPSVAVRASILWNLPNSLGMVVDKDGNKVKNTNLLSFLDGGTNHYVVLPSPIADLFKNLAGGAEFKIPQGSFNVVAPGETPFLPGFGPLITVPFGQIFAGKPDDVEFLKSALGPTLFNQLAPFGDVSNNLWDTVAPASARKAYTLWRGEDSPDYMATLDAITVEELVNWQMRGGNLFDLPTAAEIKDRADRFYKFGIIASATLAVSTTRMSEFQPMIDYWRQLNANPGMTYRDKVAKFHDKWGTDVYDPLISSTSKSNIKGLTATLPTYQMLNEHSAEVQMLTDRYGDGGASILAATVEPGPWSAAVYQWMKSTKQPGTTDTFRQNTQPGEIIRDEVLRNMWAEYIGERDMRDQGLAILGTKSVDSNLAKESGIAGRWNGFKNNMRVKYGWAWEAFGPDSKNFKDDMGKNLSAINALVSDTGFMNSDLGRSPVWQSLKVYMEERSLAQEAIATGSDKKAVQEKFLGFSQAWRWSSLQFADFWDQFLADDDLSQRIGR